jgi:Flp pilus assembly protein TadB
MSWFVDPVAANTLALVGSCFTIAMWITPIRDVWLGEGSIYQSAGTNMPASSLFYVAGFFTCVLWILYGNTRGEQMLMSSLTNSCGIVLNLSFSLCYWIYSKGGQKMQIQREAALFSVLLLISLVVQAGSGSNDVMGVLAMFINILSESSC